MGAGDGGPAPEQRDAPDRNDPARVPDPGTWKLSLESDDWLFEIEQVPSWTSEGELAFRIDRTTAPRVEGGSAYLVTGELRVPLSADPGSPLAFLGQVFDTLGREARTAQELIARAPFSGMALVGLRTMGKLAKEAGSLLPGGQDRPSATDRTFVEIDLRVDDGAVRRSVRGRLYLSPYPFGHVQGALRLARRPEPT